MMSSRFDLGSTLKTLNLFILRFIKRSGSENLAFDWSNLKRWSHILAINTNTDEIFLELDVNYSSLVYYNTKTGNMKRLEITGLPHWSEPVHCKLVCITFDDERG